MKNQAMQRMAEKGRALDVEKLSQIFTETDRDDREVAGTFRLGSFTEDSDYFVGSTEQWIWSIGRRLSDDVIFAALDNRFYQNPRFECVWLR